MSAEAFSRLSSYGQTDNHQESSKESTIQNLDQTNDHSTVYSEGFHISVFPQVSFPRNSIPRVLTRRIFKLWQRLSVVFAIIEYYHVKQTVKGSNKLEKTEFLLNAYRYYTKQIVIHYADDIPFGLTAEMLWYAHFMTPASQLKKNPAAAQESIPFLTGQQIYRLWTDISPKINQVSCVTWNEVISGFSEEQLHSSDPKMRSEILTTFRKRLWQMEKKIGKPSQRSSGGKKKMDDDDDDDDYGEEDEDDYGNEDDQEKLSPTKEAGDLIHFPALHKANSVFVEKSFNSNWFPIEWLPFICFGPLSPNPYFIYNPNIRCKNPILRALKRMIPNNSSVSTSAQPNTNMNQQYHNSIGSSFSKEVKHDEVSHRSSDDSVAMLSPPVSSNKRSFDATKNDDLVQGISQENLTEHRNYSQDNIQPVTAFQSLMMIANKKLKSVNFLDMNNYLPEFNSYFRSKSLHSLNNTIPQTISPPTATIHPFPFHYNNCNNYNLPLHLLSNPWIPAIQQNLPLPFDPTLLKMGINAQALASTQAMTTNPPHNSRNLSHLVFNARENNLNPSIPQLTQKFQQIDGNTLR